MAGKNDFRNKKIYRSQTNRMIGGVCGGVAEYFSVDPTVIRLIWVAFSLVGGFGLLVYLASLLIIPNNPDQTPNEESNNLIKDKNLFWGSLLIIVGLFLILKQMGLFFTFSMWHLPWQSIWAIALIAVGGILLYNRMKEEKDEDVESAPAKKLYRSRTQKMVAGVCGGLSEYFEMDVSIIRIIWVIGTIISMGLGVVVYIVMLILFQEEPEDVNDKSIQV